jgi:hypothetical protein
MDIKYHAAHEVSLLAQRLSEGYLAYNAAIKTAQDPRSVYLIPEKKTGEIVPTGSIKSKDGQRYTTYHFSHYLERARTDPAIIEELNHIWFTGAFLNLGDALSRNNYFNRCPVLELIRHLRHGIAHGNRFNIKVPESLIKYPANNFNLMADIALQLEIKHELNGTKVLFDFLGPGDAYALLQSVHLYLRELSIN